MDEPNDIVGGSDHNNRYSSEDCEVLLEGGKGEKQTSTSKAKAKAKSKQKSASPLPTDTDTLNTEFEQSLWNIKKSAHFWTGNYPEDGDRVAMLYYKEFWGLSVIKAKSRNGNCGWMGEVLWDDGKKGSVRWEKDKWLPIPKELDLTGLLL